MYTSYANVQFASPTNMRVEARVLGKEPRVSVVLITLTRAVDLDKQAAAGRNSYRAFEERIARKVDSESLDRAERDRRIAELRSAHFRHLASLSAEARRARKKPASSDTSPADTSQGSLSCSTAAA